MLNPDKLTLVGAGNRIHQRQPRLAVLIDRTGNKIVLIVVPPIETGLIENLVGPDVTAPAIPSGTFKQYLGATGLQFP